MRWKLLIVAALAATIVGAGGTLGIIYALLGSARRLGPSGLYGLLTLVVPLLSIFFASLFVYRHTARWRKTQALATALLSILLTLTVLIAVSVFSSRVETQPLPSPPPRDAA